MKAHKRSMADEFKPYAKDIVVQMLSVVLNVLETSYGWKGKRQLEFIENFISVKDMMKGKVTGRTFGCDELIEHAKSKYGIDLQNMIEIEVEEK